MDATDPLRAHLLSGQVIPAHPLALTEARRLDEPYQRALTRYYVDAGAGGIAVGVHTTQFGIRDRQHGLLEPVLALAAESSRHALGARPRPFVRVAGVCGRGDQALREASLAAQLGYDAALVSLADFAHEDDTIMLGHVRRVADVLPVFGFYLQPAVGGRTLDYGFWHEFAGIERVVAVKIAPFDRYRTFDVVRAIADAGRDDIALYTGNDDAIVADLVTPVATPRGTRRIAGGLLGQWAMWTSRAVELLGAVHAAHASGSIPTTLLRRGAALTDANGAIFDAGHGFAGCLSGIHEVLRRQGLLRGTWCLDPGEMLSPGQRESIDRVLATAAAEGLSDDEFVAERLDDWLRP
ncbi:MAG TPA: dihydrodipicolinate synthase family protein [Gemmatimonadaceae bacterium]|nr:dihydrodipicolinate synthase family protein [Gemmatimonadaceae bacterium]